MDYDYRDYGDHAVIMEHVVGNYTAYMMGMIVLGCVLAHLFAKAVVQIHRDRRDDRQQRAHVARLDSLRVGRYESAQRRSTTASAVRTPLGARGSSQITPSNRSPEKGTKIRAHKTFRTPRRCNASRDQHSYRNVSARHRHDCGARSV